MDQIVSNVFYKMLEINQGDSRRIEHTVKVHNYARQIGIIEQLNKEQLFILELSAILHDIGIQTSLLKHGSSGAKYQEKEGPAIAKKLLKDESIPESIKDRIYYLIAHHHTYSAIDDLVFQILVEADFLVNVKEDNMTENQTNTFKERIFRTNLGINFLNKLTSNK